MPAKTIARPGRALERDTAPPGGASYLGDHIEALKLIEQRNVTTGNFSHTTPRFRWELLYYLLDNAAGGPIVEVGSFNGGFTSMFGYVAGVTGRTVHAVDVDGARVLRTQATCASFDVDRHVQVFHGDLASFLEKHAETLGRCDLVLIDSSHDFNTTLAELRLVHQTMVLPRCIALHDFNYRQAGQLPLFFDDLEKTNPIAVDRALFRWLSEDDDGPTPLLKRVGAFSGDGTTTTPSNPGATMQDFIDKYGSEGMMVLYP